LGAELRWLVLSAALACRSSPSPEPEGRAVSGVAPLTAGAPEQPPAPSAPAPAPRVLDAQRTCMGTRCTIQAYHHDPALFDRAVESAMAEVDRLDALMSTWVPSSDVSRINAAAGNGAWVPVAPETFEVLQQSLWIARESGGAFDVTVGAFKGLWKFDEDNDGSLPARADVQQRRKLVDYRGLLLDAAGSRARLARTGQSITLGGIAKGLIVDHVVAKLRAAGLTDFVMQAGGDLYAAGRHGDREWKVGIQDPRAASHDGRSVDTSFALLALHDSAFNTSGDYERFILKDGKRYHHILDPRSGFPVSHTRSVTVLAATSFLADTLDTAVFVLGVDRGLALVAKVPGAEAVIVDARGKVHVSPGLAGRLKLLRPPSEGP
jgi:FAD:protein FMN transferase